MANKVQVKYDEMDQLSKRLADGSVRVSNLTAKLRSQLDVLQGGGWVGRGSDAFFNEMNDLMLPSMKKLEDALEAASRAMRQAADRFKTAEQEASSRFRV
jgi:WXG100 family type VII secretion target